MSESLNNKKLLFLVIPFAFVSCVSVEDTLTDLAMSQAGSNASEIEKVLNSYDGEKKRSCGILGSRDVGTIFLDRSGTRLNRDALQGAAPLPDAHRALPLRLQTETQMTDSAFHGFLPQNTLVYLWWQLYNYLIINIKYNLPRGRVLIRSIVYKHL